MTYRHSWRFPTRHLGRQVRLFDSLPNTNDTALALAADSALIGTAVLADEQTAGRGQFGRSWTCPRGAGVQLSLTIDPPAALRRPVVLTAWAAVAVAETVRRLTRMTPRIKWPNDVLLDGRKIAGILIEMKSVVVAGIGINVSQTSEQFQAAGLPDAGSLAGVTGRSFERDDVARELITQLDDGYSVLLEGNSATLQAQWVDYLGLSGREVELETHTGQRVTGRLDELTFDRIVIVNQSFAPESVRHLGLTGGLP